MLIKDRAHGFFIDKYQTYKSQSLLLKITEF